MEFAWYIIIAGIVAVCVSAIFAAFLIDMVDDDED